MNMHIFDIDFQTNVNASGLTSMKLPTLLNIVYYPRSTKELTFLYDYFSVNNLPFFILGNGSNVIFTEKAKNLNVISTKNLKPTISRKDNIVTASTSVMLSKLYRYCQEKGLSGFEKLATIPGTVGGAITMNAGCFGSSISDNLISVKTFHAGKTKWIKKEKLNFSYRHSGLNDCLILSAKFALKNNDKCEIEREFLKYCSLRAQKQPKGYSTGSIFKNSPTYNAGELIDKCGLKGLKIGGARISEKHGNFIINEDNASADDVLSLIKIIKETVFQKFGIQLEEEVKIL